MTYNHYIELDDNGRIVKGWSDGANPNRDTTNAILLRSNGSYHFHLMDDEEINPVLINGSGIPLYRWDGGNVVKRTDEDVYTEAEILSKELATIVNRINGVEEYLNSIKEKFKDIIIEDSVTGVLYGLQVHDGRPCLVSISGDANVTNIEIIDAVTGRACTLVVNDGRLGTKEV